MCWTKSREPTHHILWPSFEISSQINKGVGCDEGEISEKVCFVKEAIPFEKRETFLDQEHCQSSNLFYVSVRHFKKSELKTREDQKGYPLESGGA